MLCFSALILPLNGDIRVIALGRSVMSDGGSQSEHGILYSVTRTYAKPDIGGTEVGSFSAVGA